METGNPVMGPARSSRNAFADRFPAVQAIVSIKSVIYRTAVQGVAEHARRLYGD